MTAVTVEVETATATATAAVQTAKEETKARPRTRARIQAREACRKVATTFDPPELWSDRQESLRDVYYYARYGEWTGAGTAGRTLGRAYALLVSLPVVAVLYFAAWIVRRPARGIAGAAVSVLVALTPPGALALGWLATGLRWLADLIA